MAVGHDTKITWLGHAAFQVDTPGGVRVLIDPFLHGNPACPDHLKTVDRCDLMLITHAHGDHVGDAVPVAKATGCEVVCIVELGDWLATKGVANLTQMNKGGTVRTQGLEITMVHALHTSGITDGDESFYGGEAAGYVVKLENGFAFYHAGDTALFGDMALIGELYQPELAMLPIGDHYTMGPREAARAAKLLGVKHVIPMHYGTFPVLTGTPEALRRFATDMPDLEIHALKPGEALE